LAPKPPVNLGGFRSDPWIGAIPQQSDERGEGAASGLVGDVEVQYPAHDIGHSVAVEVCGGPQHAGEELFGLAPPEAVVAGTFASGMHQE
jgi:hypothetical protein